MTSGSSYTRLSLAFCLVLFATTAIKANSFTINNSGVFEVTLSDTGFSLNGTGQSPLAYFVPGYGFLGPPGSTINLTAFPYILPPHFSSGFANVNGTDYPIFPDYFAPPGQVSVSFAISVGGGFLTIPIGSTDPTLVLTAPIRHQLFVQGQNGRLVINELFDYRYYGEGTYTITLSRQSSGDYAMQSVGYQFNLLHTPEPTTLILFGSGVLGLIGAKLRRR